MINNKKALFILSIFLLIIINGCSHAPQISPSASNENFSEYEKMISEIANKYDLTISQMIDSNYSDENNVSKEFSLTGTNIQIFVYLSNEALITEEKGEETFLIAYNIPEDKSFDLELFTELVNSISGRKTSIEYCDEFIHNLNAIKSNSDKSFYKSKSLDFESNWTISYTIREAEYPDDYSQKLEFSGLTSASE